MMWTARDRMLRIRRLIAMTEDVEWLLHLAVDRADLAWTPPASRGEAVRGGGISDPTASAAVESWNAWARSRFESAQADIDHALLTIEKARSTIRGVISSADRVGEQSAPQPPRSQAHQTIRDAITGDDDQ